MWQLPHLAEKIGKTSFMKLTPVSMGFVLAGFFGFGRRVGLAAFVALAEKASSKRSAAATFLSKTTKAGSPFASVEARSEIKV